LAGGSPRSGLRAVSARASFLESGLFRRPALAERLEFSGSIELNHAGIGGDAREFTPAVGKFAPAPGTFRKCSPCRGVRRPGCVFFAASLVVEALLHLGGGLHTSVTPGAI